jgi:hypothetical protein
MKYRNVRSMFIFKYDDHVDKSSMTIFESIFYWKIFHRDLWTNIIRKIREYMCDRRRNVLGNQWEESMWMNSFVMTIYYRYWYILQTIVRERKKGTKSKRRRDNYRFVHTNKILPFEKIKMIANIMTSSRKQRCS